MNKQCPHMTSCPMYPLLTLSGSLKTWQIRYCRAEFETCERYKRAAQGRSVPNELMPNGFLLRKPTG